jgi:4-diphosphocytidyl-2-C-methyl-D-erythritol kinase
MAKAVMLENGAEAALLSGSGPSVFGIFTDKKSAEYVCQKLLMMGYEAHLCRSL